MNRNKPLPILKIVTVEDSEIITERMKSMLWEMDRVAFLGNADTVTEANFLINREKPDVVILDIQLRDGLAGLNGMDLLPILRRDYPQMKIMMLTNLSGPHYRKACFSLGAHYFMDKSDDFDRIPDVLESIRAGLIGAG